MNISPRYDVEANGQGNIRWHVRDINGKKFLFSQESECGAGGIYRRVSVHAWVVDKPTRVYTTGQLREAADGGVDWEDSPTEVINRTGWDVYPLHEFESTEEL